MLMLQGPRASLCQYATRGVVWALLWGACVGCAWVPLVHCKGAMCSMSRLQGLDLGAALQGTGKPLRCTGCRVRRVLY